MAIHPSATIHPSARVAEDVEIGPGVLIEEDVEVGPGCALRSGAVLCRGTTLGARNVVHYHAVLGGEPQHLAFKAGTRSFLRIGNDNVFRELCTVHRAFQEGDATTIGDHNYIMAAAHVGHDVTIGNHVVVANTAQVSGHCSIEDHVFMSGLSGLHQFVRVGRLAMIGGLTGIPKDVPPFCIVRGDVSFLVGINVVGLRRAGVSAETRRALQRAFKALFRSGRPLRHAITGVREQYAAEGTELPAELAYFLEFCEAPSKRGMMSAHRARASSRGLSDSGDSDQ